MNTRLLIWVLLFCITIPLIFPFLQAGYLQTDDGIWAIVRQAEMHRELKDGQFPARWSAYLNHGYGYPLFLFTYPLPYYLGEIIHLIGFNAIDAVKILFIASTVLSALTMFYFVTSLWGEWAGLVATTLYLYVPYRLLNLFVRGSVGELLASIFYPLLFYLFWQLLLKPSYKKVLGSASVLAALILTHNASIILFAPFLAGWIGYWLFKVKNKPPASKAIVLSVLFALGLSATFWLPALVEKQFIALSITPLAQKADHFLSFSVLLGQTLHPLTQTALSLGNFQILLSLGALILGVRSVKGQSLGLRLFLTLAIIITLFMVLPVSVTFWKLPLFKELDFPWRTLGVATFLFSVLGSGIVVSKFGQFIANDYLRPIIGQYKSAFNFRQIMDDGKILLVNLSKGRIGELNANLIGMVIVGKFLMAALSRVDIDQEKRRDFNLFIDEFQNVTTSSIATILSIVPERSRRACP